MNKLIKSGNFYNYCWKNWAWYKKNMECGPIILLQVHYYVSYKAREDYSEYFKTLQLKEDSNTETAREAFLKLAKKFHPDSGHPLADAGKFNKIENAYRKVIEKLNKERRDNDCEGEYGLYYDSKEDEEDDSGKLYDIKHSSIQHRQYLSYQGIGIGTPSQREKQYTKYQAMRATENVIDYKVKQLSQNYDDSSLVAKNKKAARNIRTRYGIDRIVEDKIQESMARGDFDNLANMGKPLKYQNHNPYVDTVTFKLNQVLINNGYAPEWVMLEKEIRNDRITIREAIAKGRSNLGSFPLSRQEQKIWDNRLSNITQNVKELNKKIDKYNFLVPVMSKQTVHFSLERELEKILSEYDDKAKILGGANYSSLDNSLVSSHDINEKIGLKTIIKLFKGK